MEFETILRIRESEADKKIEPDPPTDKKETGDDGSASISDPFHIELH